MLRWQLLLNRASMSRVTGGGDEDDRDRRRRRVAEHDPVLPHDQRTGSPAAGGAGLHLRDSWDLASCSRLRRKVKAAGTYFFLWVTHGHRRVLRFTRCTASAGKPTALPSWSCEFESGTAHGVPTTCPKCRSLPRPEHRVGRIRDQAISLHIPVLVDHGIRVWPMRRINSRVLAPDAAAKWFPVCRRSWKCRSAGTRTSPCCGKRKRTRNRQTASPALSGNAEVGSWR
jgi:hypothetical protein